MRRFLIGFAVTMVLLSASATSRAQTWRSFDQNIAGDPNVHEKLCDKELGKPDGSVSDGRSWELDCAGLDIKIENSEFAALRRAAEKGSNAERETYNTLVNAFESYKKLRLDLFTRGCGGGNGCPAYMEQEEAQSNYVFLYMAEGFRGAGFPSFSAVEAAKADAALNAAYQQFMPDFPVQCPPTHAQMIEDVCVPRSEYRDMERAWIRYRDAWVAYGAIKWPDVTPDSWRAYLAKQHSGGPGRFPYQVGMHD